MKNALFIETLTRTRYTKRWYDQRPLFSDNVASHSYRVAVFSLIAAELEMKKFGKNVDLEQVLCGAIFHDMNEVLTSTIKYGTKKNERVKKLVELLEVEKNEEIVSWLPKSMQKNFNKYFKEAENKETIEGLIVDAMDDLDAMLFCLREVTEGSKTPFFRVTFDILKNKLAKCELESVKMMLASIDLKNDLYHFMNKIMNYSTIERWMSRKNNVVDDDTIHSYTATGLGIYFSQFEKMKNESKIDIARMAAKVICHDIPEIETGDIRGPVKHSSESLKKAFAKIEEDEAEKLVNLLPKEIRKVFKDYLVDAKSEDVEGEMVEIVDKVEAFLKTTLEMRDNEFEYQCTYNVQKEKLNKKFKEDCVIHFMEDILPDLRKPEIVQI